MRTFFFKTSTKEVRYAIEIKTLTFPQFVVTFLLLWSASHLSAQSIFSELDAGVDVPANADIESSQEINKRRIEIQHTKPTVKYRSGKKQSHSFNSDSEKNNLTPAASFNGDRKSQGAKNNSSELDAVKEASFLSPLNFNKPLYLGLGLSRSEVALLSGSLVDEDTVVRFSGDDTAWSYWLVLGMTYNDLLDLELRYHDYGSFEQIIQVSDASKQLQATLNAAIDYQSLGFMLRPKLALGELFQIHAEAGLAYMHVKRDPAVTINGGQNPDGLAAFEKTLSSELNSDSDSTLSFVYGIGAEYKGKGNYAWRYDLYRSEIDDEELSSHALSVIRRFK